MSPVERSGQSFSRNVFRVIRLKRSGGAAMNSSAVHGALPPTFDSAVVSADSY
jgi:hypothetical protein